MKDLWNRATDWTVPGTRVRAAFVLYALALAVLLVGIFTHFPLWLYALSACVGVAGALANWSDPEPRAARGCDCFRCSEK